MDLTQKPNVWADLFLSGMCERFKRNCGINQFLCTLKFLLGMKEVHTCRMSHEQIDCLCLWGKTHSFDLTINANEFGL